MNPISMRAVVLVASGVLATAAPAHAQTSDWSFDFIASTVLNSMTGSLTASEITSPIDLNLTKLSESQASFTLDFDIWKGDWGLLTGIQLLEYELSTATKINNVFTRQLDETIGELMVARRLAPGAHVYAGIRTWSTSVVLQLGQPTPGTIDGSDTWVDPVVGGHAERGFSEGWFLALDADVGGLGVGSDLTWRALGAVAYELSDRLALFVEYGVLAVDYTTDARELSGTVTYDTTRHGPRIGARTTF